MDNMRKYLMFNLDLPYTEADISVVVPQASQYKKRIAWFLDQFIRGTPGSIVKNTIVPYDPGDTDTEEQLKKFNVKGIPVTPPHSTYKIQAGLKAIRTRLVIRMANDTFIKRSDWAKILVDQFNSMSEPQLIGAIYPTADFAESTINKFKEWFPHYSPALDDLRLIPQEGGLAGNICYIHGYFMASQSYVLQTLYPQIVDFNQGAMGKEDCLIGHLASSHRVKIVCWDNLGDFCKHVGKHTADFEGEEEQLPKIVYADETTEPRPKFRIMTNGPIDD